MTDCKTFNTLRKSGQTRLKICPYDKCCDGRECAFLQTKLGLELNEDQKQEKQIRQWQINKERRN